MELKTLHGSYWFENQRYILKDGSNSSYLELYGELINGYYSKALAEYVEKWSLELSYSKLSELIEDKTGNRQLSKGGIKSFIERSALNITNEWVETSNLSVSQILVPKEIDIYSPEQEEVIVMMDDVGVKAQKPFKKIERVESDPKRIDTTVALLQLPNKSYIRITEGIDKDGKIVYPINQGLIDNCNKQYGSKELPIVLISDGARKIRLTAEAIFGSYVVIILDWYHLSKKVSNLMSMINQNKADKIFNISVINKFLWDGKVTEAIGFIERISTVKNKEKREELKNYLIKHANEIIDYSKRKSIGKTIGSGRCEKANDQIVAHRQKKKGMAWSFNGSKSLAILSTKIA